MLTFVGRWGVKVVLGFWLIMSLITFIAFAMDKGRAIRNEWRIPEKTLILLSLIGGALGGFLGMQIYRHKTKHMKFKILVPLFLIIHIVLIVLILMKLF